MKLDTLSNAELFKEISELAREQGVATKEVWSELVSEAIDSHVQLGELNEDEDLENKVQVLSDMWEEYEREADLEMRGNIKEESSEDSAEREY